MKPNWSLACTATQLLLLPPRGGEGTDDLRRILHKIPEMKWDGERERWAVPLSHVELEQIRYAATRLPHANVSDGVRRHIRQVEGKAKGLSHMFNK